MGCATCNDPACCGACEGVSPRPALRRGPNRPSLEWRIDDQSGFRARILRALPGGGAPARPLGGFSARGDDDPAIALVDASAAVLDVLAFYQARIADEGFLGCATEAFSLGALARQVGHEPAPGVAAETPLAFTVEEPVPGAPPAGPALPDRTTIGSGTRVQSIPGPNETPQVFETVEAIEARRAWNRLRPLTGRPQTLALRTGVDGIWLYDLEGGLESVAGTISVAANTLRPLDVVPALSGLGAAQVTVIEVESLWLAGTGLGFRRGELLLAAGRAGTAAETRVLALAGVVEDASLGLTRLDLTAGPKAPPSWAGVWGKQSFASASAVPASAHAVAQAGAMSAGFYSATLGAMGIGTLAFQQAYVAFVQASPPDPGPGQPGLFRFRERVGFFGAGAPRWATLTAEGQAAFGDYDTAPPSVWENSKGTDLGTGKVLLDRTTEAAETGGWAILSAPGQTARAYRIATAEAEAASDFSVSGRVTALTLKNPDSDSVTTPSGFRFRTTTAHLGAQRLALATLPIVDDIPAGVEDLTVDGDHLEMPEGRRLILEGTTPDGLPAVEAIRLVEPLKLGRTTILRLDRPTTHAYRRASLGILANVARATHGETVREVLGHGDPASANQAFRLARAPLTHTAEGATGRLAAITVRVDGVAWEEARALTNIAPDARAFTLRRDAEGRTRVIFGDGAEGSRLPFGRDNVVATYRTGLGPEGAVAAEALSMLIDRPLAVRAVRNPIGASGAEAPEAPEATRAAVPAGLRALDRVVALADVAAFAEGFGGIGRARAEEIWADDRRLVALTVAAADGSSPAAGSPLLTALSEGMALFADPSLAVRPMGYAAVPFFATAQVRPRDDHDPAVVLDAARAAFAEALGFAAREIAVPITASHLLAVLAAVPGVAEAALTRLGPDEAPGATPPATILPALGARFNGDTIEPAQMLVAVATSVELA